MQDVAILKLSSKLTSRCLCASTASALGPRLGGKSPEIILIRSAVIGMVWDSWPIFSRRVSICLKADADEETPEVEATWGSDWAFGAGFCGAGFCETTISCWLESGATRVGSSSQAGGVNEHLVELEFLRHATGTNKQSGYDLSTTKRKRKVRYHYNYRQKNHKKWKKQNV